VTAVAAPRNDWLAPSAGPDLTGLAPALREALAAHWTREASFEHASIAAFARASIALLAAGAPAALVEATHSAALDEIGHTRLLFALASRYGAAWIGPGRLDGLASLDTPALPGLALEALMDGCVGEAVAALTLREAAARACDHEVRAVLHRIAEDEERHAELAFRTVAWALAADSSAVAPALTWAIERMRDELAEAEASDDDVSPDLSDYGVLSERSKRAIRRRGLAEVVIPCAEAILEHAIANADPPSPRDAADRRPYST